MNTIEIIQNFYKNNCNGDWEHQFGITIETIDNPGWSIVIDLEGTKLSQLEIEKIKIDRNPADWIWHWAEEGKLHLAGGAQNLDEMLNIAAEILNSSE